MRIEYDFAQDTMSIEGVRYELKPYRKWLISNHEQIVQGHFIKALQVGGRTKMTFDWQAIYYKAENYNILEAYERTTRETQSPDALSMEDSEPQQGQD